MGAQKIVLQVEGMSCNHCSGMVQKTLEGIAGISDISVDLEGKKASFETQAPGLVDQAVQQIIDAGYKASRS